MHLTPRHPPHALNSLTTMILASRKHIAPEGQKHQVANRLRASNSRENRIAWQKLAKRNEIAVFRCHSDTVTKLSKNTHRRRSRWFEKFGQIQACKSPGFAGALRCKRRPLHALRQASAVAEGNIRNVNCGRQPTLTKIFGKQFLVASGALPHTQSTTIPETETRKKPGFQGTWPVSA